MKPVNFYIKTCLLIFFVFMVISCAKDELPENNTKAIKNELIRSISFLKKNNTHLPSDFKFVDRDFKEKVRLFYTELNEFKYKLKDRKEFYCKYSELVEKHNVQIADKGTDDIDETVIADIGELITAIYYEEIKENNYKFIETGLILESAILNNSLLEDETKQTLSCFIAETAIIFDELAVSGVITTDTKITWDAFMVCLRNETDTIFSNPVKAIQFMIGIPFSWIWLQADCVYQTWNSE